MAPRVTSGRNGTWWWQGFPFLPRLLSPSPRLFRFKTSKKISKQRGRHGNLLFSRTCNSNGNLRCFCLDSRPGVLVPLGKQALWYRQRLFIARLKAYLHIQPVLQLSRCVSLIFPTSQRSLFRSAVKIDSGHEIRWEFYDLCLMLGNSINFYKVLWANAWRSVCSGGGGEGVPASQGRPDPTRHPPAWKPLQRCPEAPGEEPGAQDRCLETPGEEPGAQDWHRGARDGQCPGVWQKTPMVCTLAPAWPFGSWDPVQHCGRTSLSWCHVIASYGRTVTVTGYILISQARNNFLISAWAQTHCARICLQSQVPSTIPVAP